MTGEIPSSTPPQWMRTLVIGRNPKRTLVRVIVLIVLSFVLFKFILLPVQVTGISMDPTYKDGRVNFVNKLAYRRSKPQRGDVIVIRMAGEHVMLMKRIIGLPGERVSIRDRHVYINGELLEENYLYYRTHRSWTNKRWKLEDDEYLVIGDNRSMPFESHYLGRPYEHQIVGKVMF
jgi:signal peptidase I